jgi:hypothetical protein
LQREALLQFLPVPVPKSGWETPKTASRAVLGELAIGGEPDTEEMPPEISSVGYLYLK